MDRGSRLYDLTAFSSDHPGGIEALETCAGTDGTEAFEYAGHSEENIANMQQYCVGRLVGSFGRDGPSCHHAGDGNTEQNRRGALGINRATFYPWATPAVTLLTACGAMIFSYRHVLPRLGSFQDILPTNTDLQPGHGVLTGVAIASSLSFLGFRYLYGLFLSSLDYQNDVFSFPPTMPRKTRR
ncbi:hypothetical protein N7470_009833 [Penicillium chermesinum]|nr:hypothetical protein N7470_009833 [Penicillium chermesinum]